MNAVRPMRVTHAAAVLPLLLIAGSASAQPNPERIPTVVAQASLWMPMETGSQRFFDARLPEGWPSELVPGGSRVIGGSIVGDTAMFLLRTAVFELPGTGEPIAALTTLLGRQGFAARPAERTDAQGGFVATEGAGSERSVRYCRGAAIAIPHRVDAGQAPRVVALTLLEGSMALMNCGPRQEARPLRFPVEVPALTPPAGARQVGAGTSWGEGSGSMRSSVVSTMPADSVLAHYAAQLIAGGWNADGPTTGTDRIAARLFKVRADDQDWTAALIVVAAGDRRELRLEVARVE